MREAVRIIIITKTIIITIVVIIIIIIIIIRRRRRRRVITISRRTPGAGRVRSSASKYLSYFSIGFLDIYVFDLKIVL